MFPFGYLEELRPEWAVDLVNVSLLGYLWMAQHGWPIFRRRGYGRFVMTSSSSGVLANPGHANYTAAKAGVYGLAKALAFEGEAHGINVNVILPGAATAQKRDTRLADFERQFPDMDQAFRGRRGPELVAHLVAYLSSRECTFTGEAFSALGGRYARVFVGVADGWLPHDTAELSAEAIRDHIDEIRSVERFDIPAGTVDEINAIAARLEALERSMSSDPSGA